MGLPNWIIQLIGFGGTAAYLLSFQFRKNRHLFMMQAASYCFYFIHYFLLGAMTGAFCYSINLIRSILLSSNKKWAHSKYACAALCIFQVVAASLTWEGWLSLLPCIANIASTTGGYSGNARTIRAANMFVNSPLCAVYAILVGSWAGLVDEIISEASIIISIVRFGWKNLDSRDEIDGV